MTAKLAYVLCAGIGERLRPLTRRCPKALLPIGGQPMVFYVLDALRAEGVRRFLVNLHAHPEQLRRALTRYGRDHRVAFKYFHEKILLDTGGAILNARRFLTEPFWLVNCDFFPAGFPFLKMERRHRASGAVATLAVRPMRRCERFNSVGVNRSGRLVRVSGAFGRGGRDHVFLGVHRIEPEAIYHLWTARRIFPIFSGLYRPLHDSAAKLMTFTPPHALDVDLGTLEGYFSANLSL